MYDEKQDLIERLVRNGLSWRNLERTESGWAVGHVTYYRYGESWEAVYGPDGKVFMSEDCFSELSKYCREAADEYLSVLDQ